MWAETGLPQSAYAYFAAEKTPPGSQKEDWAPPGKLAGFQDSNVLARRAGPSAPKQGRCPVLLTSGTKEVRQEPRAHIAENI